jgi:uncharacterized protein (DUF433 family)
VTNGFYGAFSRKLPASNKVKFSGTDPMAIAADTDSDIDWMECELIEAIPGKVSGRPVVRGTRILPDAIVDSYDLGETIEELRDGFPSLSVSQIQRLIEFAHTQRGQSNP